MLRGIRDRDLSLRSYNLVLDPRDKRKSHLDLTLEIEELKKRRNRDMEEVKLLKVEINKLETLYKKWKEIKGEGAWNYQV